MSEELVGNKIKNKTRTVKSTKQENPISTLQILFGVPEMFRNHFRIVPLLTEEHRFQY